MRVAISQSNYLPWRGYFGIINNVECFVFLDEVQFTSRDWRSRNQIRTENGLSWLSIPVGNSRSRKISDVPLPKNGWNISHKDKVLLSYHKSINYEFGKSYVEDIYNIEQFHYLSEYNQFWIQKISKEIFGLNTRFIDSTEVPHHGTASDLILSICQSLEATEYLSGPAGLNYLDLNSFKKSGISVKIADYSGLPTYSQIHGTFHGQVSVVDLIFNEKANLSSLITINLEEI